MGLCRWSAALLFVALTGGNAFAAVMQADANHFILNYTLPIKATPAKAYAAAVDIAHWWGSDHTYSGSSANLHMDARAGGCFCEKLKAGGVEHMRVVLAQPGTMLRLSGGLGPLQSGAVDGTLTFEFKSGKDGNEVVVSYLVSGYFSGGLDKVSGGVDHVLGEQLQHLQHLIDSGTADAAAGKSAG
jgi:uncharacterized protein YndB with AHSA1/START domain